MSMSLRGNSSSDVNFSIFLRVAFKRDGVETICLFGQIFGHLPSVQIPYQKRQLIWRFFHVVNLQI